MIGGNFSGATMYNNPTSSVPTGFGALDVFGYTSGNSININNGGNAYVAGNRRRRRSISMAVVRIYQRAGLIRSPISRRRLTPCRNLFAQTGGQQSQRRALGSQTTTITIAFNAAPGSNGIAVFEYHRGPAQLIDFKLPHQPGWRVDGCDQRVRRTSVTLIMRMTKAARPAPITSSGTFIRRRQCHPGHADRGARSWRQNAAVTNDNQIDGAVGRPIRGTATANFTTTHSTAPSRPSVTLLRRSPSPVLLACLASHSWR